MKFKNNQNDQISEVCAQMLLTTLWYAHKFLLLGYSLLATHCKN